MKNNNYKGSPLFNDIKDKRLRTWNRCAIIFNLTADRGPTAMREYVGRFEENEVKEIYGMFDCIEKYGYEAVRKQIKVVVEA